MYKIAADIFCIVIAVIAMLIILTNWHDKDAITYGTLLLMFSWVIGIDTKIRELLKDKEDKEE